MMPAADLRSRPRPDRFITIWLVVGLAVLAIILRQPSVAQESVQQQSESAADISATQPTDQPSSETVALRAQLELMRQYDDRLLDTVYWSLGMIGAIALVLGGFSWYANFRMYERDRNSLRQELQFSIKQGLEAARGELEVVAKKPGEDISRLHESLRNDMSRKVDEVRITSSQAVEAARKRIEFKLNEVRFDLVRFQIEYHSEGSPRVLLRLYKEMLETALEMDWENFAGDALQGIRRMLQAGAKVTSFEFTDLSKLLGQVPNQYSREVAAIHELLSSSARE